MTLQFDKKGYLYIRLYDGWHYHKKFVHRLVAETFLEKHIESNDKWEVDHIDCNPANNRADNLQWLTREDNLKRSFDLKHQTRNKRPVQQFTLDEQLIATYESVNEAFRQTNIRHISEAARGERKTAGGYTWKYLDEGSDDLSV